LSLEALVFATTPFLRILGLTLNLREMELDLDLVDFDGVAIV
jgi:hypothetical protein